MKKKKTVIILAGLVLMGVSVLFLSLDIPVRAAGFIENTVNDAHLYSRYDISNYQLDFYVDFSGGWLPWNWGESIGQSAMYGIYAFTNVLWILTCQLAQGAGYIVQEAFQLDFIGGMADSIGKNIQTLAGVSPSGISIDGFYSGCLMLLIVVVGSYVLYVGALKRETTKAISAVTSFLVIFLASAVFIAYAPESISKVNEFSRDMTGATMNLGLKMMGEDTGTDGTKQGSTASIRDTLWRIQVDAPWELLQFGSVGEVDGARINSLKEVSPEEEDGKAREDAVKTEVTEQKNMNLSTPKVMERLGTVLFLFLMDLAISVFVFLLSGSMILAQILFIIFATYLPISFLLSMIPGFSGMAKKGVMQLFNTIMLRVGITLIVVLTFSISYLLYTRVGDYPFFLIMFVQIVTFVGTFAALPDIMRLITLSSPGAPGTQGSARRMLASMMVQGRRYRNLIKRTGSSKAEHKSSTPELEKRTGDSGSRHRTAARNNTFDDSRNFGEATGRKVGAVKDMPDRVKDKAAHLMDSVKDMPVNAKYAVHQGKETVRQNVTGFQEGVAKEPGRLQKERERKRTERRNVVDLKREELKGQHTENSPSTGVEGKPNRSSKPEMNSRRNITDVPKQAGDTAERQKSPFLLKPEKEPTVNHGRLEERKPDTMTKRVRGNAADRGGTLERTSGEQPTKRQESESIEHVQKSISGNRRDRENIGKSMHEPVRSKLSGKEEKHNKRIFKGRNDVEPYREIRERQKTNQNDRRKED